VSIGRRSADNFQAAARTLNQQLIVVNARIDSDPATDLASLGSPRKLVISTLPRLVLRGRHPNRAP
jgi:hypothetical protein